jgi:hypothetical protein
VNASGKARWREITPGLRGKDHLAVIKGLKAGEQVVRAPDRQKSPLTEGQRIKLP